MKPLVSVCIPVFNGGELILRAVRSALAQEYSPLEVVVADDASSDGTLELLRSTFGDQIRLSSNARRSGHGRTVNACIARARGEFLKFLDHDDYLDAGSVVRLAAALMQDRRVGLAFSRRRLELDGEISSAWIDRFSDLQVGFKDLRAVNHGPSLLKELLGDGEAKNWIGEPSCVMLRRQAIVTVGGFCPYTRQSTDLDCWLRVLARFDAAFVDEELCTYRVSADSLSGRNAATGAAWTDRLWMLENLMSLEDVRAHYPELDSMRSTERRRAWRSAIRGALGLRTNSEPPAEWFGYMWRRILRRRGRGFVPYPIVA